MRARTALAALLLAVVLTGCTDDDGEAINPRMPDPTPAPAAP
jgi:hypothetical protein